MKKVFIFMIKRFFVSNGIDYAMAVNNDETKVFSKYSDACAFRMKAFQCHKTLCDVNGTFKKDWFTDNSWEIHTKDGSRMILEIIEKDLF